MSQSIAVRPPAAGTPVVNPPGTVSAGTRADRGIHRPRERSARDAGIDAARAGCLAIVFLLHAMMVGVSVGAGGPVLENALEGWAWFAPATWIVQIMPLFFLIGGFSGAVAWRRRRARGEDAAGFARDRLARLVRPAIPLVAVVGLALAALAVAGVPAEIVETASFRIGQPLWFLAVYLGVSTLVPVMLRLHERRPTATLAALVGAVVAVDAVRLSTGIEAIGFANLAFVWLTMQQLGFRLADESIDRMPRRARLLLALAALGALVTITLAGPYSPDLLANLNPPTVTLVLLGVAQLALFSLVREPLRRWAERPRPARVVAGFGQWGMTLYLWHMPAFVALAGVLLVMHDAVGLALPTPLTEAWWGSRPVWLVLAALGTAALVRLFARFERGEVRTRSLATMRRMTVPVGIAVPAGVLGVGLVLVVGFGAVTALVALCLLGVALRGSRGPRTTQHRPVVVS